MSKKPLPLKKDEDPAGYAKLANEGLLLGYPVKINGEHARDDNGINYHSSIKFFDPVKDHAHSVHQLAQHLPLNPPDAKNTQIEPGQFKDRLGNDVFVIKLKGNSADKIKEHNGKFAHMGFPANYEYTPHISVSKLMHDKIKASGAKTAHEAGISFGSAELKRGPQTLKTYHHEPDSAEPKVPDHGDFTSKVNVPKTGINKSEGASKKEKGQTYKDVFHGYTHKKKGHSGLLGVVADSHKTGETEHLFNMHADCAMNQPKTKFPGHSTYTAYPVESLAEKHKSKAKGQPCAAGEECPHYKYHKSEHIHGQKPLMKPFVSDAQRRWGHTAAGKEALGGEAGVHEWDEATKGKKLPERVAKSEQELKSLIKSDHALHKFGKALSLTGESFRFYLEDNKVLKKLLESK